MFVNVGRYPSILAGTEFVKTIQFNYEIPVGNFESSDKSTSVIDFINVKLHRTFGYSRKQLAELSMNGLRHAFLSAEERAALEARFREEFRVLGVQLGTPRAPLHH